MLGDAGHLSDGGLDADEMGPIGFRDLNMEDLGLEGAA